MTSKSMKRIAATVLFGGAMLPFGAGSVFAQAHAPGQPHDQRHEKADFKDHQRQERRDYGSAAVREHQRQENRTFKYEERQERRGWYGGQYGYPQYGNGAYGAYGYPPYGYGYPGSGSYPYQQPYPGTYGNRGRAHGHNYPYQQRGWGWGRLFRRH